MTILASEGVTDGVHAQNFKEMPKFFNGTELHRYSTYDFNSYSISSEPEKNENGVCFAALIQLNSCCFCSWLLNCTAVFFQKCVRCEL